MLESIDLKEKSVSYTSNKIIIVCVFVALLILSYLFPYTGDDWAWGSNIGIDRFSTQFHDYGGRYFGYIIVMILTRCRVLKAFTEAIVLTLIIILVLPKSVRKSKPSILLISSFLIFCVPKLVLRQAIVWTAGFSNYVISTLLVLIYVNYCNKHLKDNTYENHFSNKDAIPIAMLGFVTALIVENITIFIIFMAVASNIFLFIKFKKIILAHFCYLISSVIGAVVMFSNSAYHNIASNADGYRNVGFISTAKTNFVNIIGKELFVDNWVLNIFILFSVATLLIKNWTMIYNILKKVITLICFGIIALSVAYSVFIDLSAIIYRKKNEYVISSSVVTIFFCFALLFFFILMSYVKEQKNKMLFFLFSIASLTSPLLVVSPIGSRCFFITYVFFVMIVVNLLDSLMIKENAIIMGLFVCMVCMAGANWFRIYAPVYKADINRINTIESAVSSGLDKVSIKHYPHESYLWCSVPQTGTIWEYRYKLFYGLPVKMAIHIKPNAH